MTTLDLGAKAGDRDYHHDAGNEVRGEEHRDETCETAPERRRVIVEKKI